MGKALELNYLIEKDWENPRKERYIHIDPIRAKELLIKGYEKQKEEEKKDNKG